MRAHMLAELRLAEPTCSKTNSLKDCKCADYMQVACSSSGLCPGTTAQALTQVTAPAISLINTNDLSSMVEVKQVSAYDHLHDMF